MTEKNKKFYYDNLFKEILENFPPEGLIDLINSLFGKDYLHDSKVLKLATESHYNGNERRSDIVLKINSDFYHVEVQSRDDKEIAFRVFEYSFRAAMQHGKTTGENFIELEFPKSIVFYLRESATTPHELTVRLKLPDNNTVEYKIPTKRINDYSAEQLIDNSLFAFVPFFPMTYEKKLNDKETLEKFKQDVYFIIDKLSQKADRYETSRIVTDIAVNGLLHIMKNVLSHSKLDNKEVDEIMETAERKYILDPLNWQEEAFSKGIIKGVEKGLKNANVENAVKMFAKGMKIEDIHDITGLNINTLNQIKINKTNEINLLAKKFKK